MLWGTLACLALTGCFGTRTTVRPELQVRAETLINRAIRAEQKGEFQQAELYLAESLKLSTSIEDLPVKAQALVNLARLNRLHGTLGQASSQIDQALAILNPESEVFSEAAHEKALTELASGNRDTARKWAEKAGTTETGHDAGRRGNLLGRILIALNETAAAESALKTALADNRTYGLSEEEANSLRMLGITARIGGRLTESDLLLNKALQIDKNLAVSSKIAADLEELAATALSADNPKLAAGFLERASSINLAAGRQSQAAANLASLARIYDRMGDTAMGDNARKKASKLSEKPPAQLRAVGSETTNPSSNP